MLQHQQGLCPRVWPAWWGWEMTRQEYTQIHWEISHRAILLNSPVQFFFLFFCKLFGRRNLWRVFCQQGCTLILFQKVFYMFVSNILLIPTGGIIISSPHLHLRAKAKRSAIAEQLGVHVRWCLHFWRQELCLSVNSQIVLALLPCNNHVTEWIVFHVLSPHAAFLQHIYPVQK